METVADIVAAAREREGTALELPDHRTPHSDREFATNVWKAGNLLAHSGVNGGGRLSVAVGPAEPEFRSTQGRLVDTAAPLFAALGGLVLGAPVALDPDSPVEGRAFVAPAAWQEVFETAPGCSRLAYGAAPDDPAVAHFERDLWSENPVEPPESVAPDQAALVSADHTVTHADLVAASEDVLAETGLTAGDVVRVDARVDTPGGFVAGVLAPLLTGATIAPVGPNGDPEDVGSDLLVSDRGDGALDPATVL